MCECCNIDKYSRSLEGITDLTLDWNHYTKLSIEFDSNDNKFFMVAAGEGTAKTEICYCPKCGRKLT